MKSELSPEQRAAFSLVLLRARNQLGQSAETVARRASTQLPAGYEGPEIHPWYIRTLESNPAFPFAKPIAVAAVAQVLRVDVQELQQIVRHDRGATA